METGAQPGWGLRPPALCPGAAAIDPMGGGMGSPGGLQQGRGCPWVHPEAGSCPRQIWGVGAGPGSQRW